MMTGLYYIIFLLGFGFFLVKKKLLPRLKKGVQEASRKEEGGTAVKDEMPDFRVLIFNTDDFTYTEDLAHCVEYELEKAIYELKKEGCQLSGDPFPIVAGGSIMILLNYKRVISQESEAEG